MIAFPHSNWMPSSVAWWILERLLTMMFESNSACSTSCAAPGSSDEDDAADAVEAEEEDGAQDAEDGRLSAADPVGEHLVQRGRTNQKDHDEDGAETDAEDHL